MNLIRILVALLCCFGIFKTLLNIIWLFYAEILTFGLLKKLKYSSKFEKVTFYLAGIVCMSYYIYTVYIKLITN